MAEEPDNLTLRLLRDIREQMATKADLARFVTKDDLAAMEDRIERSTDSKINSLRADVASDLVLTRKELSEQIVGLRRAVVEYHSTTVGHGILLSELEARLRRVEQHIGLSPLASH
jgi:chromosome segregation ATPase